MGSHPNMAYLLLFILPLLVVGSSVYKQAENGTRTPSWVDVCDGSYLFSEDRRTWSEANGECELYGGHLIQIDDMEENYCILDYAHEQGLPADWYWHSGNDEASEGVYRQHDGSHILWQPIWYHNQPAGGRSDNCLHVCLAEDERVGKWSDHGCSNLWHYICERVV